MNPLPGKKLVKRVRKSIDRKADRISRELPDGHSTARQRSGVRMVRRSRAIRLVHFVNRGLHIARYAGFVPDRPVVEVLDAGPSGLHRAEQLLLAGGLVALPTETVYGLGADAANPEAVARIFAAKGRPTDHPVIVHIAKAEDVHDWATQISEDARLLANKFWPGPLTLVLPRRPHVHPVVTGGLETVGLRVPNHPVFLALLNGLTAVRGRSAGIAAPSANRFGRVSPTTAAHVLEDLADYLDPQTDAIFDGGPCTIGVESTIVDCTGEVPMILRPGGLSLDAIAEVLNGRLTRSSVGPSRAPGMLAAHYAPNAVLEIVDVHTALERVRYYEGKRIGLLSNQSFAIPPGVLRVAAPDPYTASNLAPILYARLRDADHLNLDVLFIVPPAEDALTAAILDRLARAATGSKHKT
jgi:L-threonylcarbamoyladenylate synthase